MKSFIVLLVCITSYVYAANQCTPLTTGQTKLTQNIPNEFQVHIEVVDVKKATVKNVNMRYSNRLSTIRLDIEENKQTTKMFFYFKDDEILTFTPAKGTRGKCTVNTDLSNSVDEFLFGGTHTKGVMPLPLAVLHFSGLSGFGTQQIVRNYVRKGITRGKVTDVYTSCQRWMTAKNNIVLNVTHQFAASDIVFPSKYTQLLQMTIQGTGTVNSIPGTTVNIVSNFYNFHHNSGKDVKYETPDGITCPGRKIDKQLPANVPIFIRYDTEVMDANYKFYSTGNIVYDFDNQRYIQLFQPDGNTDNDYNEIAEVYDFFSQTMFKVDRKLATCEVNKNVTASFGAKDFVVMKGRKATLIAPKQFFFVESTAATYLGKRRIRGMDTDTWVATKKNKDGSYSTLQWNLVPKVQSWNDDNILYKKNQYPYPLKFQKWQTDSTKIPTIQNIFHVDFTALRPDFLQLSSCFSSNTHFQVICEGNKKMVVNTEVEEFKYRFSKELQEYLSLSSLQINQMQVSYAKNDVIIEFLIGSNDGNMDTVRKQLVQQIKSKLIKVYVYDKSKKTWKKALPLDSVSYVDLSTLADKAKLKKLEDSGKGGYKKGDMAGVGVGMALVGVLGGVGAAFAHQKYFV